ncbi:hypothetical protein M432DRAFT_619738, partial [Thermoascus aurantiacus ATCC 26904]
MASRRVPAGGSGWPFIRLPTRLLFLSRARAAIKSIRSFHFARALLYLFPASLRRALAVFSISCLLPWTLIASSNAARRLTRRRCFPSLSRIGYPYIPGNALSVPSCLTNKHRTPVPPVPLECV